MPDKLLQGIIVQRSPDIAAMGKYSFCGRIKITKNFQNKGNRSIRDDGIPGNPKQK